MIGVQLALAALAWYTRDDWTADTSMSELTFVSSSPPLARFEPTSTCLPRLLPHASRRTPTAVIRILNSPSFLTHYTSSSRLLTLSIYSKVSRFFPTVPSGLHAIAMGVSEDLIERLRSGGGRKLERPTSRQASAPMRFTDSPVDQAGINSPFTGYGVETAMCSRPSAVLDNFSRHSVQQPVFRDYIPFPSHPTPPQSSSPPSRPQMNFYIPHQDHSPRAPTTFADFAARIGQGPATPVQPSSDFDRADRRPVFMSNGYGIETYPRMGSGAEFQIPSPPFEATPHVNHSVLQQAPPQLLTEAAVQNRQPQEPEDEYAEDDRWFESAMAEVDLEIIQSTSAQGQQPRIAPMEAARPAPERVITRSPYFPAPSPSEAFNVPQSSQMRSSSRLSNTSSSVTFPKRPGSGLLMRSSAVTPPILTPTPRKAIGVRQHNAPEGVQRSPDTSDLIAVSQLGRRTVHPKYLPQILLRRRGCSIFSTSTRCKALCLMLLIGLMRI